MITIFFRDCNQISQSFYDSVINELQFHHLTCSCGHSACLFIHGYYKRTLKTGDISIRLRICRLKCSQCGITHALLPSLIVPYSQISLPDQQKICSEYETSRNYNTVYESTPSIDENNVKHVIRNYRRNWKEKLRSLRIDLSPLNELIQSCFSFYSSAFMQIHRQINKLFFYTT